MATTSILQACHGPWPTRHSKGMVWELGCGSASRADRPGAIETPASSTSTSGRRSEGLTHTVAKPTGAGTGAFKARVLVSLRPSVLDPAGEATRAAAERLGVEGVRKLRIGKAIEVDLEAVDRADAQAKLDLLADRLLANPVIENWRVDLAEVAGGVEP